MIPIRERPPLVTNFRQWIFVRENFLSKELCDSLISYSLNHSLKIPNYQWKSSFLTCRLSNDHEVHNTLNHLWIEAIDFFGSKINFIEEYYINTYKTGDHFDIHIDNYLGLVNRLDRKLSMSVQLSDSTDYSAGDFEIAGVKMTRARGSVIIFPSNFKHSVNLITSGTRYSLFTWAWGPFF